MNEPYPVNRRGAVIQHMAGNAEHWAPCTGCGAGDGEPCYSLSRGARPRKKAPCAGRVWRAAP